MAIFHGNIMSVCLGRTVPIIAVIPSGSFGAIVGIPKPDGPFRTLYLLHGIGGDHTDWLYNTGIAALAEARGIAVILPSGENGFYVDAAGGANYGQYIGKELVTATRGIFNLSDQRKDTYIAGLSMGGYGALRNGLKYSDTFAGAAGLSPALVVGHPELYDEKAKFPFLRPSYQKRTFGDVTKITGSDRDIYALASKRKDEGALPRLYLACGTEDELLPASRDYHKHLAAENIPVTYEEGPGGHEWDFWRTYLIRVLDWMAAED